MNYLYILWASISDKELVIDYAKPCRKKKSRVTHTALSLRLDTTTQEVAQKWVESLLEHAYGAAPRKKHILVLINPCSGPGKASKLFANQINPLFKAARCDLRTEVTTHSGSASDLVANLPEEELRAYDVIACCSGDGLPHEVINGLAKRSDATTALTTTAVIQLPCGSGNAMCVSLFDTSSPSLAALYTIKGVRQPLDLVSVSQENQRMLSFLSQNLGMIAECDLATEHLRALGRHRFLVGFLQRIISPPNYPCEVAICPEGLSENLGTKDIPPANATALSTPTYPAGGLPPLEYGTVNDPVPADWRLEQHDTMTIFYAGNLPFMDAKSKFFPLARPDDGLLDLCQMESTLSIASSLQLFGKMEDGSYFTSPDVKYRKAKALRVTPKRKTGWFSVDGEKFPFSPFQLEVHQGLGMTLRKPDQSVASK